MKHYLYNTILLSRRTLRHDDLRCVCEADQRPKLETIAFSLGTSRRRGVAPLVPRIVPFVFAEIASERWSHLLFLVDRCCLGVHPNVLTTLRVFAILPSEASNQQNRAPQSLGRYLACCSGRTFDCVTGR